MFALLGAHGTLASVLAEPQVHSDAAFADGVRAAARAALSRELFGVRSRVVARQAPPELALRHQRAAALLGSRLTPIDARQAYVAALGALSRAL